MKGKPTASGEQVIINNVFKYFKANNPSDRDHSLFKRTAEATWSFLSTVRRIVQQKDGSKTPGKKRPNRKEEFSKLDEFDLGVIRRIVHGYYARNETFSLKKLQQQLKEEIAFPYSISTLGFVLKNSRYPSIFGNTVHNYKSLSSANWIFCTPNGSVIVD